MMNSAILWRPKNPEKSQMWQFLTYINHHYSLQLTDYPSLHQWSIQHSADFWHALWLYIPIIADQQPKNIFVPGKNMQTAKWFQGATLNFAENLLVRRDDHPALIFTNELRQRREYSYHALFQAVAKFAAYLSLKGVQPNDRVAAVLPNIPEAVIAMLATTSIGAIWSSCSPDFGMAGLLDRFGQILPKVLILSDGYFYNGKPYSNAEKLDGLAQGLSSLEQIVLVDYIGNENWSTDKFATIMASSLSPLVFTRLPFDHPIYILFSSGTTGVPKCIVHGAGGTLLQHLKELILHTNLSSEDRFFYFTTCGWMMWNWYISGLAVGATLIQYDGSPFYPTPSYFFDLIDQEKISIWGTSAKYISALEKKQIKPRETHQLTSLTTLLSTGSPLVPKNFDYVYQQIKADVQLSSISGGTDIISCFALGNPMLPVYRGELQCIGLGMDVKIYNQQGASVINQKGELVCIAPFPSMPIGFWNDPQGKKYQQAYFDHFPNVWTHGDFAEITDRGTMIIHGRSDTTLNPGGVRIGTAEIYRQIEKLPEILDSLAVSQDWQDDSRIILFVIMNPPANLTESMIEKIKTYIRKQCSPRHVPAKIIAVPDLPRTLSGKIIELAVRQVIHHKPVENLSAIANPESLSYFKNLPALYN